MSIKRKFTRIFIGSLIIFIFCEFGIYYVVIFQCSWPDENRTLSDGHREDILKAAFIADTHLLGPIRGHWFDKLRREWQMYRSFQTAIHIFNPEVVFFLGDIFDEGQIVPKSYFNAYVERFHSLFSVPSHIRKYVIVGNHDIGFHYWISLNLKKRFEAAFNASAVRRIRLKDVNFILVNSMAMEGDQCFLCKPATEKLLKISNDLECEKDLNKSGCHKSKVKSYSRPILLQHFPMYRESDESCTGDDAAPEIEKRVKFRSNLDCLSASSSQFLLEKLNPRLILSGHTHHGCLYNHKIQSGSQLTMSVVAEHSVPSFSWRNRDNPSFFLGHFTPRDYALTKCNLPRESSVMTIYFFCEFFIVLKAFDYFPRRNFRNISSNLKLTGIILLSCTIYYYLNKPR